MRLKQLVKQININNYSWILVPVCNIVVKFSFIAWESEDGELSGEAENIFLI